MKFLTHRNTPQHTATHRNTKIKPMLFLICLLNVLPLLAQTQQQFPMEQFIGVNLRREDPIQYLNAVGFVREYRDWAIDEGNSITVTDPAPQPLPNNKYKWNPGFGTSTRFDNFYTKMNQSVGLGNVCATMKSCLPYIAGGDNFGIFSEFKPIPHSWTGSNANASSTPQNNVNFVFSPLANENTITPNSYRWISDWLFQFALKYGNGTNTTTPLKRFVGESTDRNTNKIKYIELWNEPNKYWIKTYQKETDLINDGWLNATKFSGTEYAAMASAVYDAHGQTISIGDGTGSSYNPGINLADPNMKLVLGGTAGIRQYDWKFVKDMKQWFTTNRPGVMPFKVINFHHYNSNVWFGLPGNIAINGEEAASPEEDRWNIGSEATVSPFGIKSTDESEILNLTNENTSTKIDPISTNNRTFKQRLIELKSMINADFGSNVEIWMSEFGFDTNEKSPYRVPKLKDNNGNIVLDDRQEVQGRFLVRGFLEIASAGWDRAMLFDIRDEDSGPNGALFQGSGIVKDKANNFAPKKSYYYVSTMKDALKGTKFKDELIFGGDPTTVGGIYVSRSFNFKNADFPRCYKFVKGSNPSGAVAGDIVYAVWLPTKQNLVKPNVNIPVPSETTQATLVTAQVGDINGVNQALSINGSGSNKWVVVPAITENPIYIRLGEAKTDVSVTSPTVNSAVGVSCDAIKLSINTTANSKYSIYYYEKNDKEENGAIPIFNINDPNVRLFAENITSSDILIGGLYLGHDKYHIFVTATNTINGNVSQPTQVEAITTSCSNNVLNAKTQTVSNSDNDLIKVLNIADYSLCYPIRDYNALGEWVNFSPNAPTEGFIRFEDIQGNEQSCIIDLVSLLDGNGEGVFQIEYANLNDNYSQGWIEYETTALNTWFHFPKNVIASRIKIKRLDNNARVRKLVFRGRPVSSSSYSIACCGANEQNLKVISGNTTVSAQISAGNLASNYYNQRQVVRIDGNLDVDNYYGFTNNSIIYMNSGSKITVKGRKYFDVENTFIQGCDNKWKGIIIEPEGSAYLNYAYIRDAEIALNMQNATDCSWGTSCSAFNSVFEENVTGIQNNYGQFPECNYIYVAANIFDGNKRDLKPDYPGASNSFNPYQALHGIVLQSTYQGLLGYGQNFGIQPNIFQNLATGIVSNYSNSYIQNCIFKDINEGKIIDPYWGGLQSYGGYGITTSSGKLILKGMGNISDSKLTFDRVRTPIYMYSTNFDIQDCKMTTTLDNSTVSWWGSYNYGGIYAQYDGLGSNIIKNNTVFANGPGITTLYQYNPTAIENNKIDCNQINSDISTVAGSNIYASSLHYWDNAPFVYNIYSIKNNNLIMNRLKRSSGINLLGVGSGIVENNTITSRDYSPITNSDSTFLINMLSSQKNFINKNSLIGVGGSGIYTPYNVGINLISSPNNSVTCNSVKDARIAITADGNNITGDSQSDPNIKGIAGNVLEGYNRGLVLKSASAIVGVHNHKMNRWKNASNDNKAAEFLNTSFEQFDINRFLVGNNTSNGSNDSEINPITIQGAVSVNIGSPNQWFTPQSVSNPFTCTSVGAGLVSGTGGLQTRGGSESEFYETGEHPYVNRKIVEDIAKIKKDLNLSDASSWMMERDAYNYYKEKLNGNLPSTASLKAFFKKHDNSDIGNLAELDKEWGKLNEEEFKIERKLAKETDNRLTLLLQNNKVDVRILLNTKDKKQWREYIKSVSNDSVVILGNKLLTLQKDYGDRLTKKAKQLLTINSRLSDNFEYVKYEKEVNDIYFTMLSNKTNKLTKEQENRVREIAMMCPEEAGKAPYKARSVYILVTAVPLPDWSNKCKNTIQARQSVDRTNISLSVYPNPAKDNITISLEKGLNTEGYQWQIANIAGSSVQVGRFNSNSETINTTKLNSGIYMIRVVKDNAIIKIEKFTIIK